MTGRDAADVDAHYHEPVLADLYDAVCAWRPGDDFYARLAADAASVLDVGCGTGFFLRSLRRRGHAGDLCGVDPAAAMLAVARRDGPDIEWRLGDVRSFDVGRRFELVMMTGHAFQVLLSDDDVLVALARVRDHLEPGSGRFAFETRNPAARDWEQWSSEPEVEVATGAGRRVVVRRGVDGTEPLDLVRFHQTFSCDGWAAPMRSESTLRFIDPDCLAAHVATTGLVVEHWFGDWDGSTVDDTSPEIVVVARRP